MVCIKSFSSWEYRCMMMNIFTSAHKCRKPRAKEILRTGFYRLFQAGGYYSSATRGLCKTYVWCLVPSIIHCSQNGCIYIFKSSAQVIWRFSLRYSNASDFAGHLFCQYSKGCICSGCNLVIWSQLSNHKLLLYNVSCY